MTTKTNMYLKQIRTKPEIQKVITKGITEATTYNTTKTTPMEIHKTRLRLLQPLILDKQIVELMATEENFKKLKHRLTHKISAKDQTGKEVLTTELYNKTIKEAIDQTRQDLNKLKPDYINLKNKGYVNTITKTNQQITKIDIKTIFRKG